MSCLKKNQKLVKINDLVVKAIIDTGSDISIIGFKEYDLLGQPKFISGVGHFESAGKTVVKIEGSFLAKLEIDNQSFYDVEFHVVKNDAINVGVIIGYDVLINTKIYCSNEISVKKIYDIDCNSTQFCYAIQEFESEINVGNLNHRDDIKSRVYNYKPAGTKESPVKMKIILKNDIPIAQPPRRLSVSEKQEVQNQIDDWLKKGIVVPSSSEYASPIVLARKRDGSKRLCVDYRRLNRIIVMDRYPSPLIDDVIDRLYEATVFITLDLKNGFFHVPVDENSTKFTAFVTPIGQYEFLRVPFGLSTSPATFQRFINFVFNELVSNGSIIVYMDDIVIPGRDVAHCLKVFDKVLEDAREYGLEFNWKKCQGYRK